MNKVLGRKTYCHLTFDPLLLLLLLVLLLLLLLLFFFSSISQQHQLVVFHWSLSDNKSLQISTTLLSILPNLRNAVIWMILILPHISNSSKLFGVIAHHHPQFFNSLVRLLLLLLLFDFLRVLHISVTWWSFTGVWVTASLQDSSQYSNRSQ